MAVDISIDADGKGGQLHNHASPAEWKSDPKIFPTQLLGIQVLHLKNFKMIYQPMDVSIAAANTDEVRRTWKRSMTRRLILLKLLLHSLPSSRALMVAQVISV